LQPAWEELETLAGTAPGLTCLIEQVLQLFKPTARSPAVAGAVLPARGRQQSALASDTGEQRRQATLLALMALLACKAGWRAGEQGRAETSVLPGQGV